MTIEKKLKAAEEFAASIAALEKVQEMLQDGRDALLREIRDIEIANAPVPAGCFIHEDALGTFERAILYGRRIVVRFLPLRRLPQKEPLPAAHPFTKYEQCAEHEATFWTVGLYTPDHVNFILDGKGHTYLGNSAPGGYGTTKEEAYAMFAKKTGDAGSYERDIRTVLGNLRCRPYWRPDERAAVEAVCDAFRIPSIDEIEVIQPSEPDVG